MNACHVQSGGSGPLWGIAAPNNSGGSATGGNFVVIDGFDLDGRQVADACVTTNDPTFGVGKSAHHIWVLNSLIHDCNLSGVQLNNKEWYYVIHNRVYNNSYTSGYQGSGISIVSAQCIEAGNFSCWSGSTYTPSEMDLSYLAPFHIVVAWNDVFHNMIAPNSPVSCGSHTDGNGIIMDSFLDQATETKTFPYQSLVLGNVSYINGGRGVHAFRASNITLANNTTYGNGTDTCINAGYLGDLSQQGGANNVWINNVSQSVPTAPTGACQFCGGRNSPLVAGNGGGVVDVNVTWSNNIVVGGLGVALFDNDVTYFSCRNNKCDINPLMINPAGNNFALESDSPAIGYGIGRPYLPPPLLDAGACAKDFSACP
jgi:hypothetical protein